MTRFQMLGEMYQQRGFSERYGIGDKCAIVVIDFINAFTDSGYNLGGDLDEPVMNSARFLEQQSSIPTIYTTTAYQSDYADAGYWIKKIPSMKELVLGSAAVEVDERLPKKESDILLVKKYASAFFGTTLSSILSHMHIDTLLIAGCTTSGCVRATAVDALQYGYRPIVLTDCVGDRDPILHENSLFDLGAKYADLMTSGEVNTVLQENSAERHD